MPLVVERDTLRFGERTVSVSAVRGFVERHGSWSGRSWVEVQGPGWKVPIGPGYGELRAQLRARFPDLPYRAEWADGAFPRAPAGLPEAWVLLAGLLGAGAAAGVSAWFLGAAAGVAVALVAAWPLLRLRDGVVVQKGGLAVGPPWAAKRAWHQVERVVVQVGRRRARVWAAGDGGALAGTLPVALVPALRARLWRLGGIRLQEGTDLDLWYAASRGASTGIPWGLLAATTVVSPFSPQPWTTLTAGLMATAATALLGMAIEARVTGWGAGAVLWVTGAYGVVLAAVVIGARGWLGLP